MNLIDLFDASLIGRKNDVALEYEGRTSTFGDIELRSNRIALQSRKEFTPATAW